MEGGTSEILDLSRRGLKKIEKASQEESTSVTSLILDQNELQRLDNLESYTRLESLSICNNFLLRMHGVSRLCNLRELSLNNNGILQIEGLKEMTYLKVLKLAGNNIKSIEHLNHNTHLEHLDLYNNQISIIADISYLRSLKHLNLERNRIIDLRACNRYLPPSLENLQLAHNNIQDLNQLCHLVQLKKLDSITVQGNPCVPFSGKSKICFDYRPFVLNWIMSVKSIDGYAVSAMESLKAEWLNSQGKGRTFQPGEHRELCEYLASTCPSTSDAGETEDQKKLRLILNKAQQHQQQLKEQTSSPCKSKLQSPRMQNRYNVRHPGRSPDRLTTSFHAGIGNESPLNSRAMTTSCDEMALRSTINNYTPQETPTKPVNQPLEAASKMVPVPESLMSPDYQDPLYDLNRLKPGTPQLGNNAAMPEERLQRHIVQPLQINRNMKSSPKLTKSASSSPRLKHKLEQRKGSLSNIPKDTKTLNGKLNGNSESASESDSYTKTTNQKRKNSNIECMAAVTIQKMWRGYRSRNLNRDALRILHAIQTAREKQHIHKLTCDVEAIKAAMESERKIQQLQMQAINALWKKVTIIQDSPKVKTADSGDSADALKQLTATCHTLQTQVVQLQGCMQEILRVVTNSRDSAPVATQTEISALISPQEEKCTWMKRPQSLPLTSSVAPATPPAQQRDINITVNQKTIDVSVSTLPLETPSHESRQFIDENITETAKSCQNTKTQPPHTLTVTQNDISSHQTQDLTHANSRSLTANYTKPLTQIASKTDGLSQITPKTDGSSQITPKTDGLSQITPKTDGLSQITPNNEAMSQTIPNQVPLSPSDVTKSQKEQRENIFENFKKQSTELVID